jgi:hypothetical protein
MGHIVETEHSYANTQPAHPECNWKKGASLEVAA